MAADSLTCAKLFPWHHFNTLPSQGFQNKRTKKLACRWHA